MKECPICHEVYDDNLNYCVRDGHELIDKHAKFQQASLFRSKQTEKPATSPKKNGCLKKVIIAAVVVVIGFVIMYRYMMNAATYLRVEPNQVIAAKCGGSTNVSIDYDGYIWVINHKPDWVTVEENDNDFELTFSPNTSGGVRQGTITIQSGGLLTQVELAQNAYATTIKPSVSVLKFDKAGGRKTVKVESDGIKWEVEYPQFLKIEAEDDGFIVEASSNDGDFRQGYITITEDNARTSVNFQQGGKCPSCHGSGSLACSMCGGLGGTGFGFYYTQCGWCGGRGSYNCNSCGGKGEKE